MKRALLSLAFVLTVLLIGTAASAQPAATESKVEHTKGDKVAAVIELPYPEEEIEDVVKDYLARKGVKAEKIKGFNVFRSVRLADSDTELSDLHFKVERKSRKEKDITLLYLIAARPNENVAARSESDRYKLEEAKDLLNTMVPSVEAHHLEVQIRQQEDELKKAEKKMQSLVDDSVSLSDKVKALQEKQQTNSSDQKKQVLEVARQREILEAMKNRRKS